MTASVDMIPRIPQYFTLFLKSSECEKSHKGETSTLEGTFNEEEMPTPKETLSEELPTVCLNFPPLFDDISEWPLVIPVLMLNVALNKYSWMNILTRNIEDVSQHVITIE